MICPVFGFQGIGFHGLMVLAVNSDLGTRMVQSLYNSTGVSFSMHKYASAEDQTWLVLGFKVGCL